jgi:MFS family permease
VNESPAPAHVALAAAPGQGLLLGFMTLGILVGTSNGISKVCLPLYAAALHASPWQIGLVGGLQFAGMLVLSLPLGAWIERHGSRPLFRLGAIGSTLLYLVGLTQVSQPWQLIACVSLLGLCNPFRMVPTQTEFLHLLPRLSPGKAGWNRASQSLGMFFIGPSLGAALLGWLGFTYTFLSVSAGMLLSLVIGNRVLHGAAVGLGDEASAFWPRIRAQLRIVAERASFRRTMGIEFCGQMAMSYFAVFIVLLGIREFGMSTQQAAGLVTLQGALFVATLFGGGTLLARWREETRYGLAFTLLFAHEALLFAPQSPAYLWCAAALLGVGLGTQHLTSVTRFGALMGEFGRGRVGGLFSLAGPCGGLTGAVLGGLLGQQFGLLSGFRVLSVVYALQLLRYLHGVLTAPIESTPAGGRA